MRAWLADAALAASWAQGGLSLRAAELSSALCHAFRKILQRCGASGERVPVAPKRELGGRAEYVESRSNPVRRQQVGA